MLSLENFLAEHGGLTRRYFLRIGALGAAASCWPRAGRSDEHSPELERAIAALEPYFTSAEKFRDVSRGKPLPHSLPDDKKHAVGLTRETWKLEVISDSDQPSKLGKQFTKAEGNAIDFPMLMQLA